MKEMVKNIDNFFLSQVISSKPYALQMVTGWNPGDYLRNHGSIIYGIHTNCKLYKLPEWYQY